jgi:hypothetical protein
MSSKPIQSPSYPALSLEESIKHVEKIEENYRTSAVDRVDAAKLLGYSGLSGPANMTLAALASYGLVERAGKGMMRVTQLAVSVLHPQSEAEKHSALLCAATTPPLFRDIREQFPDLPVPPEAGVLTHLNRAGFNPNAVPKAAKAFLATARFVEELRASQNHGDFEQENTSPDTPDSGFGCASVGDFIQWESQGVLQFETPLRVRWVSDDGSFVAVEGSDTAIPMSQVTVEKPPKTPAVTRPPQAPPPLARSAQPEVEKEGQRRAVFPVSEGDVTFIFPKGMTIDAIEELEAYLAVFLKKEKRNAQEN